MVLNVKGLSISYILYVGMKYILEYKNAENHNLNNSLVIYDFGYIKGFLYEDTFTMYKILNKNDTQETIEEYYGIIPKNAFSIETYACEYKNGIYKIPDFDLSVTTFLKADSLPFEPPPPLPQTPPPLSQTPPPLSQTPPPLLQRPPPPLSSLLQTPPLSQRPSLVHQGLQQKKHAYKKRNNHANDKVHLNEVDRKGQPEDHLKQNLLIHQNAVIPQWTSLEQLMKGPLILTGQVHQKQQKQLKPHLPLLKKKPFVSSQLRPHQVKVESHVQNSTNLN
jgi:hypothetical protein